MTDRHVSPWVQDDRVEMQVTGGSVTWGEYDPYKSGSVSQSSDPEAWFENFVDDLDQLGRMEDGPDM